MEKEGQCVNGYRLMDRSTLWTLQITTNICDLTEKTLKISFYFYCNLIFFNGMGGVVLALWNKFPSKTLDSSSGQKFSKGE